MFSGRNILIKSVTVDLGNTKVKVPLYKKQQNNSALSVLITAGSDGDEYAGIEATYRLIDYFCGNSFDINLTVIPILNIPGFEKGLSRNPLDNLYPKNIYPGKKNGSPSEKLIWWLAENYVKKSDLWMDLHGGVLGEDLIPCILAYETKNKQVNQITERILKSLRGSADKAETKQSRINTPVTAGLNKIGRNNPVEETSSRIRPFQAGRVRDPVGNSGDLILYQTPGAWTKVENIARDGCSYFIFESGTNGSRSDTDVNRHIEWVLKSLQAIGLIPYDAPGMAGDLCSKEQKGSLNTPGAAGGFSGGGGSGRLYRNLSILNSTKSGIWYPDIQAGDNVLKNQVLGYIHTFDKSEKHPVKLKVSGLILWVKMGMSVSRGDNLAGIAY